MKIYLFIALVLIPGAASFASSANASAVTPTDNTAVADIKTSAAHAREKDKSLNPALLYFKKWINDNCCQAECHESTPATCKKHCGANCLKALDEGRLCGHIIGRAVKNFEDMHARSDRSGLSWVQTKSVRWVRQEATSYAMNPMPQAITEKVDAALVQLPPELAVTIADYCPERVIYLSILDSVSHPTSGMPSVHHCIYNLDANQTIVNHSIYQCLKYNAEHPTVENYWSDNPIAPLDTRAR